MWSFSKFAIVTGSNHFIVMTHVIASGAFQKLVVERRANELNCVESTCNNAKSYIPYKVKTSFRVRNLPWLFTR